MSRDTGSHFEADAYQYERATSDDYYDGPTLADLTEDEQAEYLRNRRNRRGR